MPRSGCDRLREYDECLFSLSTGCTRTETRPPPPQRVTTIQTVWQLCTFADQSFGKAYPSLACSTRSPWLAFLSLSLYMFHQTEGNRTDMLVVSSLTIALASSAHSHAFWCEAIQSFVSAAYLQTDPVSEPGGHVWNCCVQTCCRRQQGCGCLRWPWWTPPPVKNTKLYSPHDGECLYKELFFSYHACCETGAQRGVSSKQAIIKWTKGHKLHLCV